MSRKPIIESGIVLPARKGGGAKGMGKNQQLLREMKKDESCYIAKPQYLVASMFYKVARDLQIKIATRREGDGTRLYRIS